MCPASVIIPELRKKAKRIHGIGKPVLEAHQLTLAEWLEIFRLQPKDRAVQLYPDFCFPSDRHKDEYLESIGERDDDEIIHLLREFLVHTGHFGDEPDEATVAEINQILDDLKPGLHLN